MTLEAADNEIRKRATIKSVEHQINQAAMGWVCSNSTKFTPVTELTPSLTPQFCYFDWNRGQLPGT